MYKIFQTVA